MPPRLLVLAPPQDTHATFGPHCWDLRHPACHNSTPLPWPEETARFFATLKALDDYLVSDAPLHASAEALFQGPIADALTHVGQLAMQRRLAGSPTRGENFFAATIAAGNVSADQPAAVQPF